MIRLARSRSIPVVFWMTKGAEYHEHYKNFALLCDLVCCADPVEAALMRGEGIEAHLLPPCMQPTLFKPFRYYSESTDYSISTDLLAVEKSVEQLRAFIVRAIGLTWRSIPV